jgi:cobalamin synthase
VGLRKTATKAFTFFEEVPGSLKGHLNQEELVRVSVTALTAGGGLFGLLQALSLSVGSIFPAPSDAALAAALLTAILEILRRLGHGGETSKSPGPPRAARWSAPATDRKDLR